MSVSLLPEISAALGTPLRRWVSRPLALWERTAIRRQEEVAWAAALVWARVRPRHILYVDADRSLGASAARELEQIGARCCAVASHAEAMAALAGDDGFGVAIVDYAMPDGDVGGLARRLRNLRPDVLMVGTSTADRRREFRCRGVDRFLPKPWRLPELPRIVGW